MSALQEVLLDESKRSAVVQACAKLVEREVDSKSGLSGLAVKGAFALVKKVRPGIITEAVDGLLDEFVEKLAPFYDDFCASNETRLESYFAPRSAEIANALLGVTDERAARTDHQTLRKAYDKLRPMGLKHVQAAVPGIAGVIAQFT